MTVLLRITPAGTRRVYAANVGDSRAVLGKDALSGGTTAVCLTVDHKASIRSDFGFFGCFVFVCSLLVFLCVFF